MSDHEEELTTADIRKPIDLIRMALGFEYRKKSFKRGDIHKNVFKYEQQSGTYVNFKVTSSIIVRANEKLLNVFGMEIVELPVVREPTNSRTAAGRKKDVQKSVQEKANDPSYVLRSTVSEKYRRILALHRRPQELSLLYTIIALITLNACDMAEDDLLGYLDSFGLKVEEKENDPTFGNVHDLLDLFKRQKYLMNYRKQDDSGIVMWGIGARSKVEMPPESIAKYVCELAGICDQESHDRSIVKAFTSSQKTSL